MATTALSHAAATSTQPKKKLRVLHVYKTWSPDSFGGIECAITTMCGHPEISGIRARIAYLGQTRKPALIHHESISAIRFPLDVEIASAGLSLSLLMNFRRIAKWADVLHFHFPWPLGDLLYLTSGQQKPAVVTYHSDIVRQRYLRLLYAPLMKWFLKRADAVVTTSPNYLATSKVLQALENQVNVIPLGIPDSSKSPENPARMNYWRDRVGSDFILFVGVIRYYKGLHFLIEAMQHIDRVLVIAGAGPLERELQKKARALGLKQVHFVGQVDEEDKSALYRLCGFFVFPSHLRSEAFGISLLEAAMHGKALISCEIGTGTSFINIHEETGLVVKPGNAKALADAIARLHANPEECRRFAAAARNRYLTLFKDTSMVESYAALYRFVVARRLGSSAKAG